ncbi:unnamed protein product [Mycena citricolor]|nr:unnamed protein product [Mycena citricolor]
MRDPPPVSLPSKRPSASSLAVAREKLAQVRQRGGSVTNEDDAWKKIKMIEDEKLADRVRNEKLVERCWDVWKQGFDWIATTSDQVADARDNVTLRLCMHRWKLRAAESQQLQDRIVRLANQRVLQSIFKAWKAKARERAQARWRASMRAKMKTVRDKREHKLLMNAFGIWSERYRARLADQHYVMTLLVRFYSRWRHRLGHLEHLDDYAQSFLRTLDNGVLERRWFYWKHAVQLQMAEHMVVRNVALRLKSQVLDIWRRRLENNHVADLQHQSFLKRRSILGWKKARHRLEFMNEKAIMHVSLKDERLLKAKYSLMRIRYFGRRLEVIAGQRGLVDAWNLWKDQLQAAKAREAIAVAHSLQTNSVLAVSALEKWRNVYLSHQNAQSFADQRYDSVVQAKLLFAWRIKLREKYKLMRRARALFNHLVLRSAWGRMRESLAEKRRVNKLKLVEARKVQRVFVVWREMACRMQNMRRVQAVVRLAILERALRKWTDRTIEVKNRELQIVLDRKSTLLQRTYNKWKWARGRHIEEVSLLESYNLVKREEDIRKIFHRWLAAARTTRHRRITLERREAEMQLSIVAVAWGRWREQFKNRQLQPIEYDVILQRQHNTLYHVFMLWQSKAQTLPAIRFNARRVKTAHWKIWLQALPRALQHKEAKEIDRRRMLTKSLRHWSEAYRTKIALKAVARARYMRLPTAIKHVPARSTVASRPTIPAPATRSVFPRRRTNTEDQSSVGSEDEERFTEPSRWRQHSRPRSVRSEISSPRRPQPIPVTRASSPARSTFAPRSVIFPPRPSSSTAGDDGRAPTSLLHELRQLQMRGKSPSERSRTREPP